MSESLLPFCTCGCGERVSKPRNKWIHNHHLRGKNNHFYGKKHKPESLKLMSDSHIEYWSDPVNCNAQSERRIEHFKDQANRDEMSEIITNSKAAKSAADKMRGGDDIIDHHYIYDHANPEKYTMKVTRSKHFKIHWWMKKAGIKVPHINEDAGEWRCNQ